MISTLGPLMLVAALWGGTNPFIRRGTKGLRDVKAETWLGQASAEIVYLLGNWRYVLPFLVNQLGSLVYVLALQRAALSLAVPVANGLAFVFTAAVGGALGEEGLTNRSLLGTLLVMSGTVLCYLDKIE